MHEDQSSLCKICSIPIENIFKGVDGVRGAVDHCHTTENIRGLLCVECNSGIGKLKDDVTLLLKAVEYLEDYND